MNAVITSFTLDTYINPTETGFYYLNSRYYDPEIGRFINADGYVSTGQGVLGNNMFSYCGNNPIVRRDATGTAWETVFDVVSLATSVAEVVADPRNAWNWAGLVGDAIDLIPFLTGVGEITRAAKVANKIDKVADTAKVVNRFDDITDTAKVSKKIHGNSLMSTKTNYGYALVDKNNNIIKFGESINPARRYTKKYLNKNEYTMKILEHGNKIDIHYWQHDMNMYYLNKYKMFPPLNKRGW